MKLTFGYFFVVFITTVFSNPVDYETKKPFTLEEAALGQLKIASFSGKWISDTEVEYRDTESKDVKVLNVSTNKTNIVLPNSVLKKYNSSSYAFSADRKFVLIGYDQKQVFRHSRNAKYVVYSVEQNKYFDLECKKPVQLAQWGPKSHTLLYIVNNNIKVVTKINEEMIATPLTNTKGDWIYNGMGDWVYEEEILIANQALWFSPNGEQLTFLRIIDEKVQISYLNEYGRPADLKNQYPKLRSIYYPKSGTKIPVYELWAVSINNASDARKIMEIKYGREVFYTLTWVNDNYVACLVTNRVQNESRVDIYDVKDPKKPLTMFEHKNPVGWANTELPLFNDKGDKALRIQSVQTNKAGNFSHIVYYEKGRQYPLTEGEFVVTKIAYWDKVKKLVYYVATSEKSSTSTQLYSVSEVKNSKPVCLTCGVKTPEGRSCLDVSVVFSKNGSYYILSCNGPDPKVIRVYKNEPPFNTAVVTLEGNTKLRNELQKKLLPEIMNLTVEVPGPFKADVRLFLPPNFDRSGKTKYPLLINVYGGPASKQISDAFRIEFGYYMSTNLKVIYGLIDGRNTLRKGDNMLFAGYKALGTYEIEDQLNVTRYLQKTFNFIDPTRTGIWGWSYGGFATTKALEMDNRNIFKCGVAVAPVADWIYYDAFYTERYLLTPQENQKGYEKASVLNNDIKNIRNKQYFLIHGNFDDNVHYQNAMLIAKLLEENDIPFELMSYPDEDHSIINVRPHLYHAMDKFWKKCFDLPK